MKRGRTHTGKVSVAKRKKAFAAAKVVVAPTYQAGRMKSAPGNELKAFDVALTGYNVDAAGTPPAAAAAAVNAMINGSELYQRDGRKTYMKSLHFRAWLQVEATAVQDIIRIVIYYDSQPNGAAPTLATLLQDSNAAAATSVLSGINLANRQRFQILRDIPILVPSSTFTAGVLTNTAFPDSSGRLFINEFIHMKGLETIYNGVNGGTIADITSGAVGFFAFSQTTDNSWLLDWTTRLRFFD